MSAAGAGLRLGVIGAGSFVSRRHLPDAAVHPDVEIAALCRRDADALAKIASHFGVSYEHTYSDWRRMLERERPDIVLIASPNALHYEHATGALEAGCHVLLEKPMTVHAADAADLVALAARHDRRLAVALNPPHWAHCHAIREALTAPAAGAFESGSLLWTGDAAFLFGRGSRPERLPGVVPPSAYRADPALNGGGHFIDGGSHLISEALWVTGRRARSVSAVMDDARLDLRAAVTVDLEGGGLVTIDTIINSEWPARRVHNVFCAAGATATVTGPDFRTVIQCGDEAHREFREADLPPAPTPLGNLVDAILGRAELLSPGEHGAHVAAVVEAAYTSARTGAAQTVA